MADRYRAPPGVKKELATVKSVNPLDGLYISEPDPIYLDMRFRHTLLYENKWVFFLKGILWAAWL